MARNDPAAYGRTISCWDDADELLSEVTGIEGLAQDIYHVLTNDHFLGPNGEARGVDVTKMAGMDPAKLARRGPVIAEVLTRDDRINTADVRVSVEPITVKSTLYTGTLDITCDTALGPFRRIFAFNNLTVADITDRMGDAES